MHFPLYTCIGHKVPHRVCGLQGPDQAFTTDLTKFQDPEGIRKSLIPENRVRRFLYEQFEARGF
jgi:hypothetical protein